MKKSEAKTTANLHVVAENVSQETNDRSVLIASWAQAVEIAGKDRGFSRSDIAEYLDISVGYFNVLLTGGGKTQSQLGIKLIERSAELLNTSVINVCLQCGMLKPEHLYHNTDHATTVNSTFNKIRLDPELGPSLPTQEEWEKLSIRSRYGLIYLFGLAKNQEILAMQEILIPELAG